MKTILYTALVTCSLTINAIGYVIYVRPSVIIEDTQDISTELFQENFTSKWDKKINPQKPSKG